MATISLAAMPPLEVFTTDNAAVTELKVAYNSTLADAQAMLENNNPASINAKTNEVLAIITNFNVQLLRINELAAALEVLNPLEQVSGKRTVSTISLSVQGTVMVD